MRRTVKVAFNPCPRRPMTTPEKIWMRSLSPSTTLVWTLTESPTPNSSGFFRYCSDSILSSNAWFINSLFRFLFHQVRPALFCPLFRLLNAPFRDFRVVAREQHLGHFHAAKFRRPRIVRILQQPVAE